VKMEEYIVKLRQRGTKTFWFLCSRRGAMDLYRENALLFTEERAIAVAADIERQHPDYEARAVKAMITDMSVSRWQ